MWGKKPKRKGGGGGKKRIKADAKTVSRNRPPSIGWDDDDVDAGRPPSGREISFYTIYRYSRDGIESDELMLTKAMPKKSHSPDGFERFRVG